jgi:hypothetical protein
MHPGLFYTPLILIGLAAIFWGLPAAHRLRPPLDIAAALAVLAGIILSALGVLLTVIPNFFS